LKKKIVSLVGLPGSGKTTVGKALEREFNWFFVDVDEQIEKEARRKIVDIIREDGEVAFRALEVQTISKLISELLEKLLESDRYVAFCPGGGALMSVDSAELLRAETFVVHIDVELEQQLERVFKQDLKYKEETGKVLRPLLVEEGKKVDKKVMREKLMKLRAERKKYFEKVDFKISSNGLDVKEIASKINEKVTNSK